MTNGQIQNSVQIDDSMTIAFNIGQCAELEMFRDHLRGSIQRVEIELISNPTETMDIRRVLS